MRRLQFVFAEMPPRGRMEALVDGIFSVAMTLLVLDIKLPDGAQFSSNADLIAHFASVASAFVVYLVSFVVLAMFWVAHHYQFRYVQRLDRRLLWINVAFLLLTTTVPFTTNLVGSHGDLSFAVSLYAFNLFLTGLVLLLHNERMLSDRELTTEEFTPTVGKAVRRRLGTMCAIALLAIGVAQISPRLGMHCFWLLALIHFVPHGISRGDSEPKKSPQRVP